MQPEAADMRVERGERRRAADVRDPRPDGRLGGDLADRAIRNAQEDELRLLGVELRAAARASRALTADPTRPRAPTIWIRSIIRQAPVPLADTGQAKCASCS